jgi:hypothetical protein
MPKYVLVYLFEPLPNGAEFLSGHWPLHITLVANFSIEWTADKTIEEITKLLINQTIVKSKALAETLLGPNKDVPVTLLEVTPSLTSLHRYITNMLAAAGATFDSPEYNLDGYLPHATIQLENRLQLGDQVLLDKVTLVDMQANGDPKQRKVLETFKLSN